MKVAARLVLRVQPSARRSAITVEDGDVVRIRVAAPAVEGKANDAVLALLASALGVRRRDLALIQGATGRNKVVEVAGLSREEALRRLHTQPGSD